MTVDQIGTGARHPTVRLVAGVRALLAEHAGTAVWTMNPSDLVEQLPELATAMNELSGVQLQMLREADRHQVGDPLGFANTAGWWATTTRMTKSAARRQVVLAERLDDSAHEPTTAALVSGAVTVDQAAVILDATDALPTQLVEANLRREAEQHLVALAAHHDPGELKILGRRILDVIAPEVAEEHERKVLEREEQNAAATASFTMHHDGHGSMLGRFKVPVLAGEMLAKHLNAIAAPKHQAASGSLGERVSRPLRLGQAFTEYIETRAASAVPHAGGIAATVVVTMTMNDLLGGDKSATLDTGEAISASEARRLACEAGIIPAVLGTKSQVLDLGRKTRFHTEPQRIALALRDGGCVERHCDWPPSMCHAHHPVPWSKGGDTSIKNGMLLCPRHHSLAHDDRYQLKAAKNGKVTFSRRT
ncbi:MAG: nuclease [Marmoricola sp.]|nr:nuclease [Marmoricola sp.]